ncbi:hypothetical protein BWQ96_09883 [Gracilariopsis chorda]|uniref:Uncharacterized protein n=1 Tax=Gracilariopsis chorda TaxID=448386 RepID=A0A2V3IEB4_9FLOR|nr:hypothetical protein BWQ96_09883 [Gracilariopsis chorda]|eukprot:PXF40404.1 hypothetical protein BWQ96_09883 [Gracilariopsis chorda]
MRLKLGESASDLRLGCEGILNAYQKTPVLRLKNRNVGAKDESDVVEDGVRLMGLHGDNRYLIDNVPYDQFERVLGKPLQFPLCIGEVWEEDGENGSEVLSSSQSSTGTESEKSDDGHSE